MKALVLLLIGALFGFHLFSRIIKNKPTVKTSIIFHALFVLGGLAFLFITWANTESQLLNMSLIFLVLAALGGMTMVFLDVVKKIKPPSILAVGHMLLALTGVTILVVYLFGQ